MGDRARAAIEDIIQIAVAPAPPLPPVRKTDAVTVFSRVIDACDWPERHALRLIVGALGLVPIGRRAVLGRLMRGRLAPLGEALASMAQTCYYGDIRVMRSLGYDPEAVVARGRARAATQAHR